ncbi:MAG: dihydropteroate synthase [Candidatus Omnitrophica bacterium]|nr:dihydropteroate synthase [Candidatus Omnitrophota bacterium]
MIIIGERINSTRKTIREAIDKKDLPFLIKEAKAQLSCGASFIDINCATSMQHEADDLIWLITEVQNALGVQISIDSPNSAVIKAALGVHKGTPFINSITAEESKLKVFLPLIKESGSCAIVLTMDEKGMAPDAETKLRLAKRIVERAEEEGIARDNIFVDPLAKPVSTEPQEAAIFLDSLSRLKENGIKSIGGLSNVSFGLPARGLLNATFLKFAMDAGIDGAIIDPTGESIKTVLDNKELPPEQFDLARKALLGEDPYAMNYIKAFRAGKL